MDPRHLQSSQFIFYGIFGTVIYYEPTLAKFIMKKVTDHDIFAVMNITGWPFGTHLYEKSDKAGGGYFIASIYTCDDEEEFVCKDGCCIPIDQR